MDPVEGELSLPGWDSSYTKEEMKAILDYYRDNVDEAKLWENLEYFIKAIMPTAEAAGVKWLFTQMTLHTQSLVYHVSSLIKKQLLVS